MPSPHSHPCAHSVVRSASLLLVACLSVACASTEPPPVASAPPTRQQLEIESFAEFDRGMKLASEGRLDEAEQAQRHSVELAEQLVDPAHPALASALFGLAAVHAEQGRYGEAELALSRCVQALLAGSLEMQVLLPEAAVLAGMLALEQGRLLDSELAFREGCRMRNVLFGAESLEMAECSLFFARLAYERDFYDESRRHLVEARRIADARVAPDHPLYAELNTLSGALDRETR
jgi:tetratricopeptide (TPR) repeat protein